MMSLASIISCGRWAVNFMMKRSSGVGKGIFNAPILWKIFRFMLSSSKERYPNETSMATPLLICRRSMTRFSNAKASAFVILASNPNRRPIFKNSSHFDSSNRLKTSMSCVVRGRVNKETAIPPMIKNSPEEFLNHKSKSFKTSSKKIFFLRTGIFLEHDPALADRADLSFSLLIRSLGMERIHEKTQLFKFHQHGRGLRFAYLIGFYVTPLLFINGSLFFGEFNQNFFLKIFLGL